MKTRGSHFAPLLSALALAAAASVSLQPSAAAAAADSLAGAAPGSASALDHAASEMLVDVVAGEVGTPQRSGSAPAEAPASLPPTVEVIEAVAAPLPGEPDPLPEPPPVRAVYSPSADLRITAQIGVGVPIGLLGRELAPGVRVRGGASGRVGGPQWLRVGAELEWAYNGRRFAGEPHALWRMPLLVYARAEVPDELWRGLEKLPLPHLRAGVGVAWAAAAGGANSGVDSLFEWGAGVTYDAKQSWSRGHRIKVELLHATAVESRTTSFLGIQVGVERLLTPDAAR